VSGVDSFSYAVAFHFGALGQLEERPPNQATAAAANGRRSRNRDAEKAIA
jgi:hypothetical protein